MRLYLTLAELTIILSGCDNERREPDHFDGLVRVYPPVNGFQLRGYDSSDSYAPNGRVELLDLGRKTKTTIVAYSSIDYLPFNGDFSQEHSRIGDFGIEWAADGNSVKVLLPPGAEPRNEVRKVPGLTISYAVR